MSEPTNSSAARPPEDLPSALVERQEVQDGIHYLHVRLGAITARGLESAAFTYALIELLAERGLISMDDLDTRKRQVTPRLLRRFEAQDSGVAIQDSRLDKYNAPNVTVIDCQSRLHLCRAACCKMQFPLSRQDIEERLIQWDLGRPYVIAKDADGYCRHIDRGGLCCTVHGARPLPCRVYDCREDPRVWIDFEGRRINPKIADPDWPHNLSEEEREPWGQP